MKRVLGGLAVAIGLVLPISASADCQKDLAGKVVCGAGPCSRDLKGRVYCARFRFGSVVRTTSGETVCGRGQCVTTLNGDVLCSNVDGGGAVKQVDGTPRCEGQCEPASVELCEQASAGQ
jgi:hypothetical protein